MLRYLFTLSFILHSAQSFADKAKLGKNINEQLKTDKIVIDGQKVVDVVDDKTMELLREYNMTLKRIEATKSYNEQLKKLIISQKSEAISIEKQIDSTHVTNQEIVPLMITMTKTLKDLVHMDAPFLQEERTKRVNDLIEMMNRADVSTSEKYRRILEAYQIENDYGRTLEAYRGLVNNNGENLTVDFLRMGRLLLIYQTLDGKEQALWNQSTKSWTVVDGSFKRSIRDGLRIARKQATPELLNLPVIKPVL
jgi:hypothetical protein